jgi:Protein of unknown function (DUF2914)/Tetratricopeptide repeat
MIDAAEAAAGVGDLEGAERLLREALALQEATLGPSHADLANTLNNLAVVCERNEKFAEAEDGYRRAHKIAVASLGPGHPFVATSLKNLVDFCTARGIPLWTPPTAIPAAEASSAPPDALVSAEVRPESAPFTWGGRYRLASLVAVGAGLLIVLFFVASWQGSDDQSEASTEAGQGSPPQGGAPALPPTAAPTPAPAISGNPQPTKPPDEANRREEPARPAQDRRPGVTTRSTPVTVLTAQVCSALERQGSPDWECTPVSGVGQPGTFTFYTRLASGSDTTIEHRWYRGDRLHQTMRLKVPASPGGYRTYSRNTVTSERAGNWKVELRSSDGALLQEEHFVVR